MSDAALEKMTELYEAALRREGEIFRAIQKVIESLQALLAEYDWPHKSEHEKRK